MKIKKYKTDTATLKITASKNTNATEGGLCIMASETDIQAIHDSMFTWRDYWKVRVEGKVTSMTLYYNPKYKPGTILHGKRTIEAHEKKHAEINKKGWNRFAGKVNKYEETGLCKVVADAQVTLVKAFRKYQTIKLNIENTEWDIDEYENSPKLKTKYQAELATLNTNLQTAQTEWNTAYTHWLKVGGVAR